MSGLISVESQLASTAQRHFQLRFGNVQARRGDGWLLLAFSPLGSSSKIEVEVQSLCNALVRDVTNSRVAAVRLSGDEEETQFGKLAEKCVSFSTLLRKAGVSLGLDGSENGGAAAEGMDSIPNTPGVSEMVEMLYRDVIAEQKHSSLAIVNFPTLLCPRGTRCDVQVKGTICIKAFSSTTSSIVADSELGMTGEGTNVKPEEDSDGSEDRDAKNSSSDIDGGSVNGNAGYSKSERSGPSQSATKALRHGLGLTAPMGMEQSILQNSYSALKLPEGEMAKVWIDTRTWAQALALSAENAVDNVLPAAWRSKAFSLAEATEVLRRVHHTLDIYWNENRANNVDRVKLNTLSLLSTVSGDLREYLRSQVELYSPDWRAPWRMQLGELKASVALCKQWNWIVAQLVKHDWANWEGGMYHDESFDVFAQRLHHVLRIRETLASVAALQEKVPDGLQPEAIFDGVSAVDVRTVTPTTWESCVAAFEKEFSFVEPKLRSRVKQLFQSPVTDTQIRTLQQHGALLRREGIRTAVTRDLDGVAAYLKEQLDRIFARFENNCKRAATPLQKLRAVRGCIAECVMVPEDAGKLFGSTSPLLKDVTSYVQNLISNVKQEETATMEQWCSSVEVAARKALELQDAVVVAKAGSGDDLPHAHLLTCTVHPSLRRFVHEVRNVRAWLSDTAAVEQQQGGVLGGGRGGNTGAGAAAVPSPVSAAKGQLSSAVESAITACEHLVAAAMQTQQCVANHNTVVAQILPCTRAMLTPVIERSISQVLYAEMPRRTVAVGNYQELEGVNLRFQNLIEALSSTNRQVRRFHEEFGAQVADLMRVDLTTRMDEWRTRVDDMRSRLDEFLATQHLSNYDDWRRHWDCQIYKALEYQYRRGLESLHEEMSEFKVELVLKQGMVTFKPSFEAIREAYYVKLREFASVPLRFRGLQPKRQDANTPYEIYPRMPLTNNDRIITVHTKAIELFAKLNRVRKAFRSHIVVCMCGLNGSPDLDSIVDAWMEKMEGRFDEGFRTVEEHREKMGKIEDVMKIDCFSISTVPVRASIEEHLHRLEDALLNGMRKHIQSAVSEIDDFVFRVSNLVERQPTTMDEVGEASKRYKESVEQMDVYEKKLNAVLEENRELRNHVGTSIELGATRARWDHLKDAMVSHTKVMEASVSKMRVSLNGLIQRFLKDEQRFCDGWKRQKAQLLRAFVEKDTKLIHKLLPALKDQLHDLGDLDAQAKELESKCEFFGQVKPVFNTLQETKRDAMETSAMWSLYDTYEEQLEKLRSEDWLTFRTQCFQFDDFCKEWRTTLTAKLSRSKSAAAMDEKHKQPLPKAGSQAAADNPIASYIMNIIQDWAEVTPLLRFVRGEGWMTEHWNEMFRLMDIPKGTTSTSLTFGMIIDRYQNLLAKEDELKQLHARAEGEIQLREALQDMRTWALEAHFTLTAPTESVSKVCLITDWKEIMTQVSDNQALVNSLKDSPFFVHFADEASGWESRLVSLSLSLTLLNDIQRRWAYLEPIFARGALPHEQARFKRVDKEFVSILREVEADARVMSLASQMDVNERLKGILEQIERCQKSLMEFLEAKREKLPRFYFISDEDLLEMLGHSQNPSVIQAHLKKLFMGIHSVTFGPDSKTITHMISADHEEVKLRTPVPITSNDVEDWLLALDASMQETLHTLLVACVDQPNVTTKDSITSFPSQILQVAQGIHFSRKVEEAIATQSLKHVLSELQKQLDALTSMTAELGAVDVLKVKALILDAIHNIEVVELLIAHNVRRVEEWWWKKQLRYRMSSGNAKHHCTVHMADTKFDYTYEYQGNAAKLVHTPLTDKCYLVLTKGMDLGYGGNPYGPAGTGKTESVKALGSAMGRQVLVFNCDEGIDFKAMGRIFVGIMKCGAWGCFDEFNRLKIDQLSAISQMIQVIQQALKSGEANCLLLGKEVDVNAHAGIFVTLNPAGKGYGGRTRLPDNLKQLFREVAMSVPDDELITSAMLFSEGFTHARALAKNIVALYRLCGQLMSRQQHYDWGLRPLKAVLRLGGTLVQRWKSANAGRLPTQNDETELMLQSLNINTLSKLTFDDARIFQGLLRDIFPGVESREITYGELESAVKSAVQSLGLQPIASQEKKVLQLYEALQQRTGVVLVGPSGSGKSTLLHILRKALQIMHITVPLHVMNPKAMPRHRLLGYMDPDTREWYDGVLTAAARDAVKQPKEARPWILCDGDIDPEWIESLNSVLDDNRLLTMPNGVRIQFGANVNFIFETHSLKFASPATVSRMGVLFFSEKDVQLEAVAESAMMWRSLYVKNVIKPLIFKYVFSAIDKAQRLDDFTVPVTRMGLLRTCLLYVMNTTSPQDFVFSLARGLGGCLNPESAKAFAQWLYAASGQQPCSESRPFDSYWLASQDRVVEFTADLSATVTPTDLLTGRVPVIQTVEVQRLVSMFKPLLDDPKCTPIFVVGPEGCGKGALLEHVLASRPTFRTTTINCSAQTNSTHVVQKIEQLCVMVNSNAGRTYRPREGERLVIILKNVNLPKADKYGTVELHSFLQQLIPYQGFYNQDLEWIGTERVQIVASMNPTPSAGRYPVTPRLLALSSIISVSYPSKTSLVQVYATYWSNLLRQTDVGQGKDYEKGTQLAHFMLQVYERVRKQFEGEEYAHFAFCPRHLTKWVSNVLLYNVDTRTTLPAVLAYEASRIFADCLPRAEDRRQALRIFAEQLATIGYAVPPKEDRFATMFVTWLDKDNSVAAKTKKDADSVDSAAAAGGQDNSDGAAAASLAAKGTRQQLKLQQKKYGDIRDEAERALLRYSREFKELYTPLIPDVLCWVTYVDRVLARPGGHLVLVGSTGVGRRSAVLLAAYQQHREVVSLHMTQDYALKQFRLDLRSLIQRATSQNTPMVLLLEDHNIVDETFLEYINSLLSGGEVPGLFTQEEMEAMFSSIREDASSDGHMGPIYAYFVERLQRNLRVALLMDPRHELFLIRLQSNPALLSRCELLWMGTWSSEMTKTIAKAELKDEIVALEANPANKGFSVHREMNAIHESMCERSTPHDVQVLVSTFHAIMASKSHSSKEKMERLEAGLAKLKEAEESVEKVKKDVAGKKKDVEKMQKAADKALNEIQTSMQESQEQRDEAATLEEQLKSEQKDIATNRSKVEEELSSIKPMMEAARDAVSAIRSEQLNEIRSLPSPPEAIRVVLEGVLALLGVNDVSWQSMRQFLGERGAKQRILDFEVKNVTPDMRRRVDKLLRERASFFKPETIQRASVAAAPMAEWVKAMLEYSTIMERIAPLTEQLEQLENNQKEGAAKLGHLQKKLKKIDVKVKELREGFSEKCKEAERLRAKLVAAEEELGRAKELLGKLSGEKDRWAGEVKSIREANDSLPKRALVAAGFLTYLGRETEAGRRRYLTTWCRRLNLSEVVDVTRFLRTEGELLQWKSEGLPADDLSLENAVVMLDSKQTPLIVDPANKAVEWVKEHLRVANAVVEVISLHDERFTHTLELAIRFGKTLLVTEVSDIAPLLYPVLRRDLTSTGSKQVVQVGNKVVEWQDTFRIFLFSRQSEVRLSPSAAALVTEVNFSVTSLGLEGQLLGVTLQRERPELEQQKVELLKNEEGLQLELNKLEQRLLDDLADSQGNLLENTKLIKSLNEVKMQAAHIGESLKRSHDLQRELDEKREVYRPFAHHGAKLFFIIEDMVKLNRMYQFGITDYIALFAQTLNAYKGSNHAGEKVQSLVTSFTKICFQSVARGLFKKDRLVFGLHVLHGVWPSDFPQDLWGALVGTVTNVAAVEDAQLPQWAPVSSKIKYASILSSDAGRQLAKKWDVEHVQKWSAVMQSPTPEQALQDGGEEGQKGAAGFLDMEQLLWINTFRPDRMAAASLQIILRKLGLSSLVPVMSIEETILGARCTSPVLLITSSGADPSMEVQDVANHLVGKERFVQVALGGGQTDSALQQLRRCAVQGNWLLLKNLHLVLSWASVLENELCSMPEPNADFRLIITTEQHDLFPSVLLRVSNKVTVEAPPGVKQNLLRTYGLWDAAFLSSQTPAGARLLLGLAWFHAVVQERRTYVPQGWSKYYEFSPADLKTATDVLTTLTKQPTLDWVTLTGFLENCLYGGRLETATDVKALRLLIQNCFNEMVLLKDQLPIFPGISAATAGQHGSVVQMIESKLPDVDPPLLLCLCNNADRTVQEEVAHGMRESLRELDKEERTAQMSGEQWRERLSPVLEVWRSSDVAAVGAPLAVSSQSSSNPTPMEVFFISEANLLGALIADVRAYFATLQAAAEGTIIPDNKLRAEATELMSGRMPSRWLDRMDGPHESKLWLALLARKYSTTCANLKQPLSQSATYDLSSLLRPQTFFNALRQHTARVSKSPLVDLVLIASMNDVSKAAVTVKVASSSLQIQGAGITRDGRLTPVQTNSPSSIPLPADVTAGWVDAAKSDTAKSNTTIPVYADAERQTVVFSLSVECGSEAETGKVALNGVACYLVSI